MLFPEASVNGGRTEREKVVSFDAGGAGFNAELGRNEISAP